jgi:hypothetical protein
MHAIARGVITALTGIAVFYFVFWVGGAMLFPRAQSFLPPAVVAAACGAAAGAFVWRQSAGAAGLAACIVKSAFVTGAIAFCAGFFGPMLLTPEANQGPLLGLFITGPLGFIVGGIGGAVYWVVRHNRPAV